ncbi:MAG: AzlD domain-containing protein [Lachnospiraceae bacterium]|nr:AzlD domain-containing protein [Lachnospiraceae bacterium]
MQHNIYIYMLIMAAVTYAIRVLPLTLIRKEIKSTFLRSFLYYVPYVTLAVMTFPAIIEATNSPVAGAVAFIAALLLAWFGAGLFQVSVIACIVVFIIESIYLIS